MKQQINGSEPQQHYAQQPQSAQQRAAYSEAIHLTEQALRITANLGPAERGVIEEELRNELETAKASATKQAGQKAIQTTKNVKKHSTKL